MGYNPAPLDVSGNLQVPTASLRGGVTSGTATTNQFMTGINTSGAPSFSQPSFGNISGIATSSQLPTATASALDAIKVGSNLNISSGILSANTGTSGSTIPLLSGNNTWSGTNAFGTNAITGSNFSIIGGSLNGTTIGSTTPSTGSFSSLTDTGAASSSGSSCLQVSTAGVISNTGVACGSGGAGTSVATLASTGFPGTFIVTSGTGAPTISDSSAGIALFQPNQGGTMGLNMSCKPVPTTPFTITMHATLLTNNTSSGSLGGFSWLNTSNNASETFAIFNSGGNLGVYDYDYSDPTTYHGSLGGIATNSPSDWLQIHDDGTTITDSVSLDGIHYIQVVSIPIAGGALGPSGYSSDVCLLIDGQTYDTYLTVDSFSQTNS